jgi:hypothetical protein
MIDFLLIRTGMGNGLAWIIGQEMPIGQNLRGVPLLSKDGSFVILRGTTVVESGSGTGDK